MLLNLPFLYFVWTGEYCQTSPNKNKSPNLWHVTSILSKNSLIFDKSDHLPNNYEQKMLPFCNSFWPIFPLIIWQKTKLCAWASFAFCGYQVGEIPKMWHLKSIFRFSKIISIHYSITCIGTSEQLVQGFSDLWSCLPRPLDPEKYYAFGQQVKARFVREVPWTKVKL